MIQDIPEKLLEAVKKKLKEDDDKKKSEDKTDDEKKDDEDGKPKKKEKIEVHPQITDPYSPSTIRTQ
jgi:hypothetical protein